MLNAAVELCVAKLEGLILFDFIATEDLHMPESYSVFIASNAFKTSQNLDNFFLISGKKHVRKHYVLFVGIRKGDRRVVLDDDETKKVIYFIH